MPALTTYQAKQISQAREICAFVEDIAELVTADIYLGHAGTAHSYYYDSERAETWNGEVVEARSAKADMAADLRAIRHHALVTKTEKDYSDESFKVTVTLTTGAVFVMKASRDAICTPKVVGTETKIVKDYEHTPMIEKTVDVIEWECSPLLDV